MIRSRGARLGAAIWILSLLLGLAGAAGAAGAAPAPARHVPGELLVKFRPGARSEERQQLRSEMHAHKLADLRLIGAERVKLEGLEVEQAVARYRHHPLVEYVEPNVEVGIEAIPDDPLFPQLYGLMNSGQSGGTAGADIAAPAAWDLFTGDSDLRVGVVDSGVDYLHPDLAANVWTNPGEIPGNGVDDDRNGYVDDVHGYDFFNHDGDPLDDNGHGTHVAGTLGAVGNNGIGVVGVAWRARIVALKFLGSTGTGPVSGAIEALEYMVRNGIRLSNHSWSGPFSQALLDAIEAAGASGHLCVVAAGNTSSDLEAYPTYPAAYDTPYRITVAASTRDDALASFSNFGATHVDLAAPGADILSTRPDGAYAFESGTSMAAPYVTGAIALLLGRFPALSTLEARQKLLQAVDPKPAFTHTTRSGGRLNARAAAFEPDPIAPSAIGDLAVAEAGSNRVRLTWTAPGDDGTQGRAKRYDLRYSLSPITEATFADALPAFAPEPQSAGAAESVEVGGLAFSTTYHFAVRALDELQNPGPISNPVTTTTLGIPRLSAAPTTFAAALASGGSATQVLTLRNEGAGTLDFQIPPPLSGPPQAQTIPSLTLAKGETDPRVGIAPSSGSGGPDAFGYRWIDSDAPGGPVYEWVEIAGTSQAVAIQGDDTTSTPIPIGMSFPFYGSKFTSLRVCSNGFITFDGPDPAHANQPLPSPIAPALLVAPYWDDLQLGPRQVWVHGDGIRFVVEWLEVYRVDGDGPYSFQLILEPDGDMVFQYQYMNLPAASGTVGIQDGSRTLGLLTAFNAAYVHDQMAVRITAPAPWLTVEPSAGRIAAGASAEIQIRFDAVQLSGGTYRADLRLLSNDPGQETVEVPVQLTVAGGPAARVDPPALDFGQVYVGFPPTRIVAVANRGSDPLHVARIAAGDPSVTANPGAFMLGPGETQSISVTWSPVEPAALAATLVIESDDPVAPRLEVRLSGAASPAPVMAMAPDSLAAAAATALGSDARRRTRVLTLRNRGGSDLAFSATALDEEGLGWLSVNPAAGVVRPGALATLEVGFEANGLADGDYRGGVRVVDNDPAHPEVQVPCRLHVGVRAASLDLDPGSLNRGARGKWVAGVLDLPPDLDPHATVAATVRAQRTVPLAEGVPIGFQDLDGDRDDELRLKFDRTALLSLLPDGDAVPVEVIGEVEGVSWFQAVDRVRLLRARPASADAVEAAPSKLELRLAGPSPARGELRLRLGIPEPAPRVMVEIYDLRGARVRVLANGAFRAGWHRLEWDGSDERGHACGAGVYFIRLESGRERNTLRVLRLD